MASRLLSRTGCLILDAKGTQLSAPQAEIQEKVILNPFYWSFRIFTLFIPYQEKKPIKMHCSNSVLQFSPSTIYTDTTFFKIFEAASKENNKASVKSPV